MTETELTELERDSLMRLLAEVHTLLTAAGVAPDGTLSDRTRALLKRLRQLEADRDMQRARLIEMARERDEAQRVISEIYAGKHGSIPHPAEVWAAGIWLVKHVDEYQGHAERLMSEEELAQLKRDSRDLDDLRHDVGVLSDAGIYVSGDDAEALRSDETMELFTILQTARDTQNDLRYQKRFHAYAAQWWKAAAKRWRESYHALDIQHAHRELERDCWKTAAKAFRRRWREACAELEGEARS